MDADSATEPFGKNAGRSVSEGWLDYLYNGLLYYYLTTLIVLLGIFFGYEYLKPSHSVPKKRVDLLAAFANWDGGFYGDILVNGYNYDPDAPSNVAFFPAYPIGGSFLVFLTGMRPELALLIISHFSLSVAFVFFSAYLQKRPGKNTSGFGRYVLLAMGLFPLSLFCRVAYSESTFLALSIIALYGMEARWPLLFIAVTIGLATATRPVGVALLLPLGIHLWVRSPNLRIFAARLLCWGVVACSGIFAFMLFQWLTFHEPLAFAKTQENYWIHPQTSLQEKLKSLALMRPIWSIYVPGSPCYWKVVEGELNPLFSLQFANPFYYLFAILLVLAGAWKRWLTRSELALAAGLLLIPYVTRAHEMCMGSMARFTVVVFPIYLVLGRLVEKMPRGIATSIFAISAFFLGVYSAMFAASYLIF